MSFLDIAEKLLNLTRTENGDLAYESTEDDCLDYFYLVGGKRGWERDALRLYIRAFLADPKTALKLLIYTRDIKGGLGEREIFRTILNQLAIYEPDYARKVLPYILEYGRHDDLLCLLMTPLEKETIAIIQKQLNEDIENKKAGKPISLLAKWLPSINTSSEEARAMAFYLSGKLHMSKAEYRKTLSFLRKGLIVENDLREKSYDFKYESVPSAAMNKYRKAFAKNDEERFEKYLESVAAGNAKMNIGVLDIVNFIKRAKRDMTSIATNPELEMYFETCWQELVEESTFSKKTLVVRDGSGSMYGTYYDCYSSPIDVADALTLLTSARLTGQFKDKFITFSSKPNLINLSKKKTLKEKLLYLQTFNDISTTNIQKVFDLIINVYDNPYFKKEDAIDQIMIVSDMQFDCLDGFFIEDESTFEYFKRKFSELGYKMPEVIFWNVEARNNQAPVEKDETGVKLVSGGSKNIIGMVIETESINPLDFMNKVLEKYDFIDKLFN